jgi:hypothetical protein
VTAEVSAHGQHIILAQRRLKQKFTRDKDVIRSTWLSLPAKKRTEMILESIDGGAEAFPQDENDRVVITALLAEIRWVNESTEIRIRTGLDA